MPWSKQRLPRARKAWICVDLSGLDREGQSNDARLAAAAISLNWATIENNKYNIWYYEYTNYESKSYMYYMKCM